MEEQIKDGGAGPERGGVAEMLGVALPMVVSLSCDTLMTFTDRLFLAKVSPEAMNASMGGGIACFLLMTFFVGLIGYTNAMVAQSYGAGDKPRAGRAAFQALLLALAAWPLILGLGLALAPLFLRLGLPPAQAAMQREYFTILLYGTGIGLLRGALGGFFSGLGRTKVVMVSALVALAVNALAAWCLIFGHLGLPAMGIRGAAIGTLIGGSAGLLVLVAAWLGPALRREFALGDSLRLDRPLMAELLRLGSPAGLELFLNLLAFNLIIQLLHQQGPVTATAATILFNWDLVSFLPLVGIEIGVTSLVGRYVGAQDPAATGRAISSALKLCLSFAVIVFIAFLFFPGPLVEVFRPDHADPSFDQAAPLATGMLRLAALYVASNGLVLTYAGALRGAGDTFFTMLLTVSLHYVLLLAIFVSFKVFGLGPIAAWAWVVGIFTFFPVLLWLRWRARLGLARGGVAGA